MRDLNDEIIQKLLKDSRLEMPFSDFEDRLMAKIQTAEVKRNRSLTNLRLSWLFFTMGAALGVGATWLIPRFQLQFFGLEVAHLQMPLILVVVFVCLWQLDGLLRLTSIHRKAKP